MRSVIHYKGVKAVPTKSATATIRSRYAEQAASDLGENRRQQKDLAHHLEVLRQEEALLLDILKLAEDAAVPPPDGSTSVAGQDREELVRPAGDSASPVIDQVAPTGKAPSPPPARAPKAQLVGSAAKQARQVKDPGKREPLLRELLLNLLKAHNEPRLAAEIREELLQKYPDRRPTPQVVRNTLESLVAKGCIERYKQNRTVMYTVIEPAGEALNGPASIIGA
ncbi:hypothetical protein ACIBQ5_37250 [Streptomyces massasporeus]|uniref:hypothetical protein n=1 Tax=Streptomyces massasporeus TaxID=67324 RepID=UPI0037923B88